MTSAPVCDIDLYADEVQGNLYPYVAQMRQEAPIWWLSKYGVYYATTYSGQTMPKLPDVLSSVGGIGLIDNRTTGGLSADRCWSDQIRRIIRNTARC